MQLEVYACRNDTDLVKCSSEFGLEGLLTCSEKICRHDDAANSSTCSAEKGWTWVDECGMTQLYDPVRSRVVQLSQERDRDSTARASC